MVRPRSLFAIGDVHGCLEELDALIAQLPLTSESTLVFLGDYIDRGPQSRAVIDRLIELQQKHHVMALRGNHEAMLLEFLEGTDPGRCARFILNGGSSTLADYADANGRYSIPESHLAFFRGLPISYESEGHYFVHAGVPDIHLRELDPNEHADLMMWTRRRFHRSTFRWEKMIVHGHSPVETIEVAPNRINLDTGCVYRNCLSAMEFPSHRAYRVHHHGTSTRTLLQDGTRRAAVRFRGQIPVELEWEGERMPFETVDYSEIGLGIRSVARRARVELPLGAEVVGTIGERTLQLVFRGKIERFTRQPSEEVIGLSIDSLTPKDEP